MCSYFKTKGFSVEEVLEFIQVRLADKVHPRSKLIHDMKRCVYAVKEPTEGWYGVAVARPSGEDITRQAQEWVNSRREEKKLVGKFIRVVPELSLTNIRKYIEDVLDERIVANSCLLSDTPVLPSAFSNGISGSWAGLAASSCVQRGFKDITQDVLDFYKKQKRHIISKGLTVAQIRVYVTDVLGEDVWSQGELATGQGVPQHQVFVSCPYNGWMGGTMGALAKTSVDITQDVVNYFKNKHTKIGVFIDDEKELSMKPFETVFKDDTRIAMKPSLFKAAAEFLQDCGYSYCGGLATPSRWFDSHHSETKENLFLVVKDGALGVGTYRREDIGDFEDVTLDLLQTDFQARFADYLAENGKGNLIPELIPVQIPTGGFGEAETPSEDTADAEELLAKAKQNKINALKGL